MLARRPAAEHARSARSSRAGASAAGLGSAVALERGRAPTRCRRGGRRSRRSRSAVALDAGRGRRPGSCSSASSGATAARSAVSSRSAVVVADRRDRAAASPRRRRGPGAPARPGPRAGVICLGRKRKPISPSRPSRRSPAAARTIASSSPSASLRRRVSTLPRSSTDLEVGPHRQQLGAAAQARGADPRALRHVVERGRRRRSRRRPGPRAPAPRRSRGPSGISPGRSLAEWTPMSASPVEQRPLDPAHEARLVARLAVGGRPRPARRRRAARRPARPARARARCRGWRSAAADASGRLAGLAAQLGDVADAPASASGSVSTSSPNSSRRALT